MENVELWLYIPDLGERYQVSNIGRVKSLSRIVIGWGSGYLKEGRILKPSLNSDGYKHVSIISCDGIKKTFTIHKLVATCFLNNCIPLKKGIDVVCHKDGDRTNDIVENLYIGNHFTNSYDRFKTGTTNHDIPTMREMLRKHRDEGYTAVQLSEIYKSSPNWIRAFLRGDACKTFHANEKIINEQ